MKPLLLFVTAALAFSSLAATPQDEAAKKRPWRARGLVKSIDVNKGIVTVTWGSATKDASDAMEFKLNEDTKLTIDSGKDAKVYNGRDALKQAFNEDQARWYEGVPATIHTDENGRLTMFISSRQISDIRRMQFGGPTKDVNIVGVEKGKTIAAEKRKGSPAVEKGSSGSTAPAVEESGTSFWSWCCGCCSLTIVLCGVAAVAYCTVSIYNGLSDKLVRTEQAWRDIDVKLQLRYDLLPNLFRTVGGYAKHERETLQRVSEARGLARTRAERIQAENNVTHALRNLLYAVNENYPQLQANQGFMSLQGQLAEVEGEIAAARHEYNDVVGAFHTALRRFPNNAVGGIFGFREVEFFQIEGAERETVRKPPQAEF